MKISNKHKTVDNNDLFLEGGQVNSSNRPLDGE